MDLRLTFNEDVVNYDKWRPRYCDELFSAIIDYSQLNNKKQAVEIGCGTGQATEPILKTGCSVIAVEYGNNLAAYAQRKFQDYKNFTVQNLKFEEFECESGTIDLVYSATAFHWIPEDVGYKKVFDILKSGGTLALFWNRPNRNKNNESLHQKIQEVYSRYEYWQDKKPPEDNEENRYQPIIDTIKKYGFQEVECRIFNQTRSFNADEYVSLLNTYSDHIAMPEAIKTKFYEEIKDVINSLGGGIDVYNTMDLYLAKKP